MADHFTPRLQLPYPDLDDPADVPADMQQLADRLDVLIPAGSGAGLVLNRVTVGDVSMAGQVRAGRPLAVADFTALGLAAPRGLWNLSDATDSSGNGRNLTNKGAIPFTNGIGGAAAAAAQFNGGTGQAFYIVDTGAGDPFRITTGSWGCWFRSARRGISGTALSKIGAAGTNASAVWGLLVNASNNVGCSVSDGTNAVTAMAPTDVCDDRWHFVVCTYDGGAARTYLDGVHEATAFMAGPLNAGSGAPLNIGGFGADAGTVTSQPFNGRIDEAFVTADVLSEEQVRNLYCVRIPHTLGLVPSAAKLNVTRRRRGGAWAVADFPVQPLRLYNFSGSLADQGSNNVALTAGLAGYMAGPDGLAATARYNVGTGNGDSATDAGLPQGTGSRSYGCWVKTQTTTGMNVLSWGTVSTGDIRLQVSGGAVWSYNAADAMSGIVVADALWHLVIVTEENLPADGWKRKLYVDGRLSNSSTVLNPIVLAGAGRFRVGADPSGAAPLTGQVDGVFVTDVVLSAAQIAALWAKGTLPLTPSPKGVGEHIEAWDAASLLATFDTLDSNWQVDLGVAA